MNLTQLQPHQCFQLSCLEKTMAEIFPWDLMQECSRDIMVFEKNFKDLHRISHIHGNAPYSYLISCIPKKLLSPEFQTLQNSLTIPLRFRHVWLEINDYNITVLNKGKDWYANEQECRQKSLIYQPDIDFCSLERGDKKIVLSVESVCECLLGDKHKVKCSCLCHSRQCTHFLNDHVPQLQHCRCVDARSLLLDGVMICRAPWRKPACIEEGYIFHIPQNNIWFSSKTKNIQEAYYLFLENKFTPS